MSYVKLLDNMTWSFSRLHSWEQCPYLFYLKYIEKREGESNYFASNGKCMHEVFEAIFKNKITLNECTTFYADNYELICEKAKQSTMDSTYEKCMDYLCTIQEINLEKYEIIGVELKLDFKIGKYKFVGYADLVIKNKDSGEIILVDHKQATHFMKKNGTPLKNQLENFLAYRNQMYIYCKGLKECLNINVDKIVWHHFKDNGELTVIPFVEEEYERTMKWVIETIGKIKKDNAFINKSSYLMCSCLCDYRNDCEYQENNEWSDEY